MKNSLYNENSSKFVIVQGELSSDEYDYVMRDDGTIKKIKKPVQRTENSAQTSKKAKPDFSSVLNWVLLAFWVVYLIYYLITGKALF